MWQSIRQRWRAAGIDPRSGVAASDLEAFEQRYGVRLPAQVREFYTYMDGMPPGACDEELMSFWPLSQVGPVPVLLSGWRGIPDYGGIERTLPGAESNFVFADHSIWLHVYAVRLSPDPSAACPVVWIAGGARWEVQTASFAEFMRMYAENPRQVLFPGARHA